MDSKKGLYGLSAIPTKWQEKADQILKYQTPEWLNDLTLARKADTEKQPKKIAHHT